MLRLYDTATGEVRELALREPGKVSMYVCGPTVYGPPHLGHGRHALVYDVLARYLRWSGYDLTFVSNITDIDDKIIDRGVREGRDPAEIARRCEDVWWRAMDAIGVDRPDHMPHAPPLGRLEDALVLPPPDHVPHATSYVEGMVELVRQLVDIGRAYVTSDGVYLSVESVEGYGLLAHQSLDDMRSGGGEREVLGSEDKRHWADFALWKLAKPGEPAWPSPWGDGRPGWHTECVVMSLDLLGERFDLHTGGQDLKFPHHENERAQAVALGKRFANHWMHHGFVVDTSGEKMSKSLGNFTNLLDLIESVDPRAYRLLVLQSHYRSPLTVDKDTIGAAERALGGLDSLARRSAGLAADAPPDPSVLDAFRSRMDEDLDTPGAMAVVFDAVRRANAALDAGDDATAAALAAAVRSACSAVGLALRAGGDDVPADVVAKTAAIDAARAAKDYAAADALRSELQGSGWVVETSKAGTSVRRP